MCSCDSVSCGAGFLLAKEIHKRKAPAQYGASAPLLSILLAAACHMLAALLC